MSTDLGTMLLRFSAALLFIVIGSLFFYAASRFQSAVSVAQTTLAIALTLVGATIVLCGLLTHAVGTNSAIVVKAYGEAKAFFNSPIFYILLGCLFLYAAFEGLDKAHSAFVFLLAILGIAIVLYGTGTQAAGSGKAGDDMVGATMNVAIAGGAGVLAAFFGFGVLHYHSDIQDVFKRTVDYGVVQLQKGKNQAQTVNLNEYDAVASMLDGRLLPLWRDNSALHIMVPIYDQKTPTQITLQLRQRSPNPLNDLEPDPVDYKIDWSSSDLTHDVLNNLKFSKMLDLLLTTKKIETRNPINSATVKKLEEQGITPPTGPTVEVQPQ